jgi:hypothetical protein
MSRIASWALCAVAVLLLAPFEAAAKSGGARVGGVGAFHAAAHAGAHRGLAHRGFAHRGLAQRRFPLLAGTALPGGYYDASYGYALGEADNGTIVVVRPPEPPRVLTCERSRQTVTVDSEYGGTREIRITRC